MNPFPSAPSASPRLNHLAALYARVSTDRQENSLELQLATARQYATGKGLQIPDDLAFPDSDTSGGIPFRQRPGGQLLLNTLALRARAGDPVHHIIVTKLDRLGRSVLDLETQLQHFKANNITLHITDFAGDSFSTSGFVGDLVLRVLFAVAEFERAMIRARAQDVIDHKREQGILLGHAPYGWNAVDAEGQYKSGKPLRRLEPNAEEQRHLIQMWQWKHQLDWSWHAIARELNRAGVRTKTGQGRWQSGNVRNVLTSRYTRELLEDFNPSQKAA